MLAQLEYARGRLERLLEIELGELAVVLHGSPAQLDAAQPWLPVQRRLTAPAARRYEDGWAGERELHVLSPRLLAQRASNVEGSLEMLMLAPSAQRGTRDWISFACWYVGRLIHGISGWVAPPTGRNRTES